MQRIIPETGRMIGRIDVHSHLLPGVDDGCQDLTESIACAKRMVEAGYTHSFCTPHIWPNLDNRPSNIPTRVRILQQALDEAGVALKLLPGGELHLSERFCQTPVTELMTYNGQGLYALFDFWTQRFPVHFDSCLSYLRQSGIQPILAHPERIEAVQNEPEQLLEWVERQGLLLQCNLECLGESVLSPRRRLAERWLIENRYFLLGSDLHNLRGLEVRLQGLKRAIELVGEDKVWELTHTNPVKLLGN